MNEELDSQLSAMFDNELPAAECELMARRLSRDEELKARWGRYAAIGATIRAEGGARLNADLARRVSTAISTEPVSVEEPVRQPPKAGPFRWWAPVASVGLAASVAAAAILWVRYESPQDGQIVAQGSSSGGQGIRSTAQPLAVSNPQSGSGFSYVVPKTVARRSIVPSTQLANYVVAHSEFSSPVNRRNLLSALMASEAGAAGTQSGPDDNTEDANDDAKSPQ